MNRMIQILALCVMVLTTVTPAKADDFDTTLAAANAAASANKNVGTPATAPAAPTAAPAPTPVDNTGTDYGFTNEGVAYVAADVVEKYCGAGGTVCLRGNWVHVERPDHDGKSCEICGGNPTLNNFHDYKAVVTNWNGRQYYTVTLNGARFVDGRKKEMNVAVYRSGGITYFPDGKHLNLGLAYVESNGLANGGILRFPRNDTTAAK